MTSSRPEEFEGLNDQIPLEVPSQIFDLSNFASGRDTVQIKGMGVQWPEQRDHSLLKQGIQGKKPKEKYSDGNLSELLNTYTKSMKNMQTYHNDPTTTLSHSFEQYMHQSGQQPGGSAMCEPIREQDSLSVRRQNLLRQKEQQHTTIRQSESPQVRKTHFFDNRSKYMPLKRKNGKSYRPSRII